MVGWRRWSARRRRFADARAGLERRVRRFDPDIIFIYEAIVEVR